MHLALVITELGPGGAERVLSTLANAWVAQGHQVTLITLGPSGQDFYPLDARIRRLGLALLQPSPHPLVGLWRMVRRIQRLRACVRTVAPDGVLSFTSSVNLETLLATLGLGIPTVVSERSDPERQSLGRLRRYLRRWLYPWAAALVVQTPGIRDWYRQHIPTARVVEIANPVMPVNTPLAAQAETQQLMALGRLVPEKGFADLLRAFAGSVGATQGWRLLIVGEGRERPALEALAQQLGIADRVEMPGLMDNPASQFARSPIYVLSSHHEGLPNALLEAMAQGCGVVSVDCPGGGPAAMLNKGDCGLLVAPGDVTALGAALDQLMADRERRVRLGRAARQAVVVLAPEVILARWEALWASLSAPAGPPEHS